MSGGTALIHQPERVPQHHERLPSALAHPAQEEQDASCISVRHFEGNLSRNAALPPTLVCIDRSVDLCPQNHSPGTDS